MNSFVTPTARSVTLCLAVTDAGNGSVHYGWVFDALRPEAYPHTAEMIGVVLQLSDGLGDVPLTVEITRLADETDEESRQIGVSQSTVLHFPNRLVVHRANLRLRNVVFPSAGRYLVEVYCIGECLGDAPLRLHPTREETPT